MTKAISALLLASVGLLVLAQTVPFPSPTFGGAANCGTPSTTNLKAWYSADCMTAISPCATSHANGYAFQVGDTWKDRSVNANDLTLNSALNTQNCHFNTGQINSLPAVNFASSGGNICGWLFGSTPDTGATSWAIFVVYQASATGTKGDFTGDNIAGTSSGIFKYYTGASKENGVDKASVAAVGNGNASQDTSWHQLNVRFSNQSDQNTLVFRIDRTADGPASFSSQNINTGMKQIGMETFNNLHQEPLVGNLAEFMLYAGTGVIVSAGNLTTNETYLNCRYGL